MIVRKKEKEEKKQLVMILILVVSCHTFWAQVGAHVILRVKRASKKESLILFLTTLPPSSFISIFSVRCWQAVDQTCTQPSMNAALTTNNTSMQIPPPRKYGRFRRVIRGNMLCAASPKSLVKYMASQKILN